MRLKPNKLHKLSQMQSCTSTPEIRKVIFLHGRRADKQRQRAATGLRRYRVLGECLPHKLGSIAAGRVSPGAERCLLFIVRRTCTPLGIPDVDTRQRTWHGEWWSGDVEHQNPLITTDKYRLQISVQQIAFFLQANSSRFVSPAVAKPICYAAFR